MTAAMHQRVERIRQRGAIRRWEFRQRRYAHGVWFRLRRVLADAAEAYAIDDADVERLLKSGNRAESVGAELEPKKTLAFVERSELAELHSARRVAVELKEIVATANLALIRFA